MAWSLLLFEQRRISMCVSQYTYDDDARARIITYVVVVCESLSQTSGSVSHCG